METVFTVFDHHYYVYLFLCVTFFNGIAAEFFSLSLSLAMFARPDRRKKEGGRGGGGGGRLLFPVHL